jgi:DNA-binding PadR family transcriptional regulator
MTERKIYLTTEKWWQEKKRVLNEDLINAESFVPDQEIIKLMQELLKKAKINTVKGE